ncbi:MAG: HRDC domain-containing protein [Ilumatobacteraceae bacterium]
MTTRRSQRSPARPTSLDELARIRGVGPAKLEQYGDSVLAVIADDGGDAEPDET